MGQYKKKIPISGKKKKGQLKEQKIRRAGKIAEDLQKADGMQEAAAPSFGKMDDKTCVVDALAPNGISTYIKGVTTINQQPRGSDRGGRKGGGRSRYNLQFSSELLEAEHEKGKIDMYTEIETAPPGSLEYTSQDFFPDGLTSPERPEGYKTMTKDQLEMLENKSVRLYAEKMDRLFGNEAINLYEQNTETWKQLWRVCDKSDVLLFIVDVRFAVCQFPPYVYHRLAAQGCGVLLVLSKVDLVPASVVLAWKQYFENLCPGLQVVPFCSYECVTDRKRKLRLALISCQGLVAAVERAAPREVDLSSWKKQLEREALVDYDGMAVKPMKRKDRSSYHDGDELESDDNSAEDETAVPDEEPDVQPAEQPHRAFTIGTIGYPNVGKSSLINAIMGKYKVSVSPTPGHTKHFQTHYLTPTKDLMLCDCPGLVFPAICPYKLQVLSGTFPIAQVRCPISVVGYLASHINVFRVLSLDTPALKGRDPLNPSVIAKWTPFDVAEAWALKRHYHVKGPGGRLDTSRAANELLRKSLNAKEKLVLALYPKGYQRNKVALEAMTEQINAIKLVQGIHATTVVFNERLLGFGRIPRGTKPGNVITGDIDKFGRRSKEDKLVPLREKPIESEESEEEIEEVSDDDEEAEGTHDSEELSDEDDRDGEPPITGARKSRPKESVVSNKFAALDLLSDDEGNE